MRVFFKGNMPPIEVSSGEAGLVQNALENARPGAVIQLGNLTVKVSEIKGVQIDPPKVENPYEEQERAWQKEVADFQALTVEQKVNRKWDNMLVHLFRSVGKDPKVYEVKAKEYLTKYFAENPKRYYPDIITLRAILKGVTGVSAPVSRLMESVALGMAWDKKLRS